MKSNHHPGIVLKEMLEEKKIRQSDLSRTSGIANSILNSVLNGNRNINIKLALSLENAGFKTAEFWLQKSMMYLLTKEKDSEGYQRSSQLNKLIPTSFFKSQGYNCDTLEGINKLFNLFKVNDINALEQKLESYQLDYFRKSSKFNEERNNIVAWSTLAKARAKVEQVNEFHPNRQKELINELNACFFNNKDTQNKVKNILKEYGIKFLILERPPKCPVDGQSFMLNDNPAIVLSLRYKRLDNFAFTLFHELGHVFLHFSKSKYKNKSFWVNHSRETKEEAEADKFATENLINPDEWETFMYKNIRFSDDVIYEFSKKINVHPGIIRGRVCHVFNQYYRRRSAITKDNKLN